jgi:hypothetical protein
MHQIHIKSLKRELKSAKKLHQLYEEENQYPRKKIDLEWWGGGLLNERLIDRVLIESDDLHNSFLILLI